MAEKGVRKTVKHIILTVKRAAVVVASVVGRAATAFARNTVEVFRPTTPAATEDPFMVRFGRGVAPLRREAGGRHFGRRSGHRRTYLALLGITAGAMCLCTVALWVGSLWKITEVRVEGCTHYAPTAVCQRGGLTVGREFLGVNSWTAERRILQALPLVEDVQVRKHIDGSISVTVTEYQNLYYTQHNQNYYVISAEDNLVLEISAVPTTYRLMGAVYIGLPSEARMRVGEPLTYAYLPFGDREEDTLYDTKDEDANKEFDYVQSVIDTVMGSELSDRVNGMELSDRYTMYLILDGHIKISVGKQTDLARKLDRAARILQTETYDDTLPVVLDVSDPDSASIRTDATLVLPSWAADMPSKS